MKPTPQGATDCVCTFQTGCFPTQASLSASWGHPWTHVQCLPQHMPARGIHPEAHQSSTALSPWQASRGPARADARSKPASACHDEGMIVSAKEAKQEMQTLGWPPSLPPDNTREQCCRAWMPLFQRGNLLKASSAKAVLVASRWVADT
jgi:hypothetical protein